MQFEEGGLLCKILVVNCLMMTWKCRNM